MSLKLKALSLGLLAACAMSAFTAATAGAETGGHFTSELETTRLTGFDTTGASRTEFHSFGQSIFCDESVYHGTQSQKTVTEVTITPTYAGCEHSLGPATVNMNGCDYKFTIGKKAVQHNTVHLICTGLGPRITVNGPFGKCVIEVTPNQTPAGGVAYETGGASGPTHDIEANATTSGLHAVRVEGGFFQCGTSATTEANAELTGKATLQGFNPVSGNQVGITATGSEG
jgi:hypothetical protein